jgi:mycoredoxin
LVFEKRNIWDNPEDAAFVRSVARGNETVPTLVVKGVPMVNPSLEQIAEALL